MISATDVRAEWEALAALSRQSTKQLMTRFATEQPVVAGYVQEMASEFGRDALEAGLRLALTVDLLYERTMGCKPTLVTAELMERADAAAQSNPENIIETHPAVAIRRFLDEGSFAQPGVPMGLFTLMMEKRDDEQAPSAVVGFLVAKGIAMAYEFANPLEPESGARRTIAEAIESESGSSLPSLEPDQPCPCGSGKAFDTCHGILDPDDELSAPQSHAEQLFGDYLEVLGLVMEFFREINEEPAGKQHWAAFEKFEQEFSVGDDGGVFESIQLGYFLLDLPMPQSKQTVAQRLLSEHSDRLTAEQTVILQHLSSSYLGLYEYVGRCPDAPQKQLRDLSTGQLFRVSGADDPQAEHDFAGEMMIVRLAGPERDAVMIGMPVLLAAAAKNLLTDIAGTLHEQVQPRSDDPIENNRFTMKAAVPAIADFLVSTGLLEFDEDDDDGDDGDDDEFDLEDDEDEDFDDEDEEEGGKGSR